MRSMIEPPDIRTGPTPDDQLRSVAWAIAEAWWRKHNRRAAGTVPEASSSTEYADNFWQGFEEEAAAAIGALGLRRPVDERPPSNAGRF